MVDGLTTRANNLTFRSKEQMFLPHVRNIQLLVALKKLTWSSKVSQEFSGCVL